MSNTTDHRAFVEHLTHDAGAICALGPNDLTTHARAEVTCPQCISLHRGAHNCGFRTVVRMGMFDGSTLVACPCGRQWTER